MTPPFLPWVFLFYQLHEVNYVSRWINICPGLSLIAEFAHKVQEEVRSFGLKINYKQTLASLHLRLLAICSPVCLSYHYDMLEITNDKRALTIKTTTASLIPQVGATL